MNSRKEALAELRAFMPRVPNYAATRNYILPEHENVSRLSKWIRHRVISEEECIESVLSHHPFSSAEKFLQEILWRVYWKGWLELRPAVWQEYLDQVATLSNHYQDKDLYRRAIIGETSLTFFDEWVQELRTTGYLHNHARMWFASVWIFTLKLPWQLGACFMYQHLLDGDAAANTLSWRWVAGLHTPGKTYLATPQNIATYSKGRWKPHSSELHTTPRPPQPDKVGPASELPRVSRETPAPGSLIVIHDDDLSADLSAEFIGRGTHYCLLAPPLTHSSPLKNSLITSLRADAAQRTHAPLVSTAQDIVDFAKCQRVSQVHMMAPRVGFDRASIVKLESELRARGIEVSHHRRTWDERLMPMATSGFFKFWEAVKPLLKDTKAVH